MDKYTVAELFSYFENELEDSGFTRREKRQLIKQLFLKYLNYDTAEFILNRTKPIEEKVMLKILADLHAIQAGNPIQYVLGSTYFYDLSVKTDNRALIPRPETEELVDWVLQSVRKRKPKIVDIGTGTGCIPLALKKHIPDGKIFGIDVEQSALSLAKENADTLSLNVQFSQADALNLEKTLGGRWDMIVSNPPYIPLKDKTTLSPHVLNFEPHSALFVADDDPLVFYRSIASFALSHLKMQGLLFFELNEFLADEIADLVHELGFSKVEIKEDLEGKKRMLRASF